MANRDARRMKAVFVVPNMGAGGAERVISILADGFSKREVPVSVVYFLDNISDYPLSEKIEKIFFSDIAGNSGSLHKIRALRKLIKAISREYSPVVIPFHDTCLKYCTAACAMLGVPVVACERNNPYIKGSSALSRMRSNFPYLLSEKCVFQTEGAKEYYYSPVQKKSFVIPNPLNEEIIEPWHGAKSRVIVSVGRLEPQKNQMMLIEAFAEFSKNHPDYCLKIYGEGSLRGALTDRINELSLSEKVELCGISKEIGKVLSSSRLFVLPSDYEGMSNALIEAMASGVPVISTDHPTGGARALINDGVNGVLTPVGDSKAFADAMSFSVENTERDVAMGCEASKLKDELSKDAIVSKWLEVIEVAVCNSGKQQKKTQL